jgi:hypothetical protein
MAEVAGKHGSPKLGRTETGKKVCWMRIDVLNLMVMVLLPETHRNFAGDEHLREETTATVGRENQEGRRKKGRSRRSA